MKNKTAHNSLKIAGICAVGLVCTAFCALLFWTGSIGEINSLIEGHNDEVAMWLGDIVEYVYALAISTLVVGSLLAVLVSNLLNYVKEEEQEMTEIAEGAEEDEKEIIVHVHLDKNGRAQAFVDGEIENE